MREVKVSRRDFLKLALTGIGAFLASCVPSVTQTLVPTLTSTSTGTNTPEPTSSDTPMTTATPIGTRTPTEIPCFHLLTPENEAKLPAIGKVTFSWESMPGAVLYQLQFTFPSGKIVSFDTANTSSTRYIESFIAGGNYTWQVIALNSDGRIVCSAKPFAFEKLIYNPPSINQNNSGDDDGSGNTAGESVVGGTVGD